MSPEELDQLAEKLAPKIISGVRDQHHDFWIDPETHYQDHSNWRSLSVEEIHDLKELIAFFIITKNLFLKAFLGFAVIGAIVMTAIGLGFNK